MIADEVIVQDSDLGVNFFLDASSRGKSRAQCCADLLVELNPDVEGDWWPKTEVSLAGQPKRIYPLTRITGLEHI